MILARHSILKWSAFVVPTAALMIFLLSGLVARPEGVLALILAERSVALRVVPLALVLFVLAVVLPALSLMHGRAAVWIEDGKIRAFLNRLRIDLSKVAEVAPRALYIQNFAWLSGIDVTTSDGRYFFIPLACVSEPRGVVAERIKAAAAAQNAAGATGA